MIQNIQSDKIFYLKYPKLITNFQVNNFNSKDLFNINTSVLTKKTEKPNTSTTTKFDKKNKNNTDTQDVLDTKKNKPKNGKRNKKQEVIDKDDLFFNKSLGLIKSHKINKYKKKDKKLNQNDDVSYSNDNDNFKLDNSIIINKPLTVQELSNKLSISEAKIITDLFLKGISVTINDLIDIDVAIEVAKNYDFNILSQSIDNVIQTQKPRNQSNNIIKRAPIITILGHVDHGKTTLLDSILNTKFIEKESGGITQAINGYEVNFSYETNLYKLVFLDTPGHEAFSSMRLRGAKITDIILLVVAADDGLKPQTIESIKYIIEMKIPYIIAINKIDKEDLNIARIKQEFMNYNVISKEFGGDAIFIEVSALKNINIDLLLSNICLVSDTQNLFSNPDQLAEGTILESYLDKKQGLIANMIVQNGTLKIGDWTVAGNIYGKIKSIIDINNNRIDNVLPSSVIKVLGFSKIPKSGISFQVFNTEKEAKESINKFINFNDLFLNDSLKLLNSRITFNKKNVQKKLSLIIKTDTQGSLEAILNSLSRISQSKVQLNILSAHSGNMSNTDIELALTANSIIIAFGIDISSHINHLIKQKNLSIKVFNVIYDLLDYINKCMLTLVDTEYERTFIGSALVQEIFYINKGSVAGCLVSEGKLNKSCYICVYREKSIIYEGNLISLKHLKEDVEEVALNKECGVMCDYNEWSKKDIIYAYELNPKEKSL